VYLANMLVCVAMLASTTQGLAQDGSKGQVSPYYHFILASCQGKNLEVTLKSGQKLSGRCHTPQADHFEITRKGVTHDIPYISIAKINIRQRWFSKLKDAVVISYVLMKMAITREELYKF
jgi:hypothetical protein